METEYYKSHECKNLTVENISIILQKKNVSEEEINKWFLFIRRLATEEDLENNHSLETIGEIIIEAKVEISFCPYCGEKLINKKTLVKKDEKFLRFVDSSSYNYKVY